MEETCGNASEMEGACDDVWVVEVTCNVSEAKMVTMEETFGDALVAEEIGGDILWSEGTFCSEILVVANDGKMNVMVEEYDNETTVEKNID
ncbi:hypothetical protein Cni_G01768 [Canna indica]|uniref:Uncharacterized protein n=1 Tax=Canna indica TaxID=4628 RepID=A0AAQ3PYR9_9LILI|nr:hypothetical protein Cni_G01768 [Canna indica]